MSIVNTAEYSRETYSIANSVGRAFRRRCPHCGVGKIFKGYLKLSDKCSKCSAPTGEIRADDLPPYLTILLVGHIIVPALLVVEGAYHPPMWMQMVIWPSLTLLLTLSFLPFIKGAAVGLMWHLKLSGDEQR